ncbi:MAG TPA: hypothetical protein VGN95_17310 [Pyrinomonadaceae bacterium]|nr:hypothetical protein [Pyrinomonadaceae bacterium]
MNSDRCSICGVPYQNFLRICERCRYAEPVYKFQDDAAREEAGEIRKIYLWELVEHPRLLAAAWFAAAGAIPSLILLIIGSRTPGNSAPLMFWIVLLLVTAGIAGVYGAALGALILDPLHVGTGFRAFVLGCVVAGLSFVTFAFLLSLVSGLQANSLDFFSAFVLFMFYGSILAGWAVLLIGGAAGWLLFKRYRCGVIS